MRSLQLTAAFLGAALAAACGQEGDAAAAEHEHSVVGASVATVETARFTETADAVGTVVPRMGHVASLAAPAPTRISNVFVAVGARVNKGDPLVEFEQAPFDAASKSADAALFSAQKAADRALRLADAGVLPRKEAEAAASELAQAQANAVNARRARELSTLRAPIAGVVTRMSAVLGAGAEPNQPMVEVADTGALDAVLTLSPSDASRVRVGQAAALHAAADAAGEPVASGRVADVAAAVDTASRGVTVRVEVASGNAHLRIGQSVFGRIVVAEHARAVVVPVEALVPDGEGFKVFVVDSSDMALARAVKVGGRSDTGVWISEGLKAGERVVTRGAYGVDDSVKVETGEGARGEGAKKDVKGEQAKAPRKP